jgi:Arc-like DNA binding domain
MAMKRTRAKADYVQLNVRMKEAVRRKIEKAAGANEVSMNSEVVRRLEQSFSNDDRFGGPRLIELVETMARVMKLAGETAGLVAGGTAVDKGRWLAVPFAYDQAVKAAVDTLEYRRPVGKIVVPEPNVAEVVGGDPEQSVAVLRRLFADLGPLLAERNRRDEEMDK